jgi:hypothetical protein
MLLPRGAQETVGADAIARRFEGWFGGAGSFTVLSTVHRPMGSRWLLQWRFRLSRDGQSNEVIEQVAFADVGPAGINRLDLLCSGFLPDPQVTVGAVLDFDACAIEPRGAAGLSWSHAAVR